jgi:hypothetical protein
MQLRKEADIEILDPGLKAAFAAQDAEMAASTKKQPASRTCRRRRPRSRNKLVRKIIGLEARGTIG